MMHMVTWTEKRRWLQRSIWDLVRKNKESFRSGLPKICTTEVRKNILETGRHIIIILGETDKPDCFAATTCITSEQKGGKRGDLSFLIVHDSISLWRCVFLFLHVLRLFFLWGL